MDPGFTASADAGGGRLPGGGNRLEPHLHGGGGGDSLWLVELELLRPGHYGGVASEGAHHKGGDPGLGRSLQGPIWGNIRRRYQQWGWRREAG